MYLSGFSHTTQLLHMQYPPAHVRYTHQSMPIMVTPSKELRGIVLTAGSIHHPVMQGFTQNIIPIAMVDDLSWLILTLDRNSTGTAIIIGGVLERVNNCCSYSLQESP